MTAPGDKNGWVITDRSGLTNIDKHEDKKKIEMTVREKNMTAMKRDKTVRERDMTAGRGGLEGQAEGGRQSNRFCGGCRATFLTIAGTSWTAGLGRHLGPTWCCPYS